MPLIIIHCYPSLTTKTVNVVLKDIIAVDFFHRWHAGYPDGPAQNGLRPHEAWSAMSPDLALTVKAVAYNQGWLINKGGLN